MSAPEAFNASTRRKSELYFTLPSVVIVKDTDYNLINLLKAYTPDFGLFYPFFNTTSDKLNSFDEDSTLTFKCSLGVTWNSGAANRAMTMDFLGTNGNRLTASRNAAVAAPDILTFPTFFSIDKGGNIATNGTSIILRALQEGVVLTSCLLIAEQRSFNPDIRSV